MVADVSKTTAANKEFRKARQAEDGKRAMLDYENTAAANRAKTARLKALRLARDAEEAAAEAAAPPKVEKKKKAAKKKYGRGQARAPFDTIRPSQAEATGMRLLSESSEAYALVSAVGALIALAALAAVSSAAFADSQAASAST